MKNNRVTKTKKFLFNNKSYLLIFLIFVIVFVYGRNFGIKSESVIKRTDNPSHLAQGIYDLKKDMDDLVIDGDINTSPGTSYRLFFDIDSKLDSEAAGKTEEKVNVDVFLTNDLGDKKLLETLKLTNDQTQLNVENIFYSDNYYNDIKIRKEDPNHNWIVTVSNISLFALGVRDQSQLSHLKAPIRGITNFDDEVLSNKINAPASEFVFSRKHQKFGQTFTANTEMISKIRLNLEFIGSGGSGNYQTELYEYDPVNGIATEKLGYYNFDKNRAIDDLAAKTEVGFYDIPLAVNLVKGKQYIFLVSNEGVEFNPINTLKIHGYKKSAENNKLFSLINSRVSQRDGSLSYKIFGVSFSQNQDKKILTNAIIQDLGNGRGMYTYKQHGNFSDFLDIYETHDQSFGKTNVFYDNVLRGVSAKDKDNTSFTYKFDTIYPINRLGLSLEQPGGAFTDSKVFYSFDNKNWQEIEGKQESGSQDIKTNEFEKIISVDGRQNEFYVKIGYDEESKNERLSAIGAVDMFAIKNLMVTADLVMTR